jgi:hypothetical protein
MSHARPDDEAALRSILRAAADQVEPRVDGLERIQHRLTRPRPLAVAWAMITWTRLSMRLSSSFRYLADRVVTEYRIASERFMPPPADREGRRARLTWLRPVAALSTAVAVIGAVVYLAAGFSQVASQTGADTNARGGGHHGGATSGQSGLGKSQAQSTAPQTSRSGQSSSSGSPNCATSGTKNQSSPPATIFSPPSSTSPTGTTSPSPSQTPTPTTTPTPTPTPSSSSTDPSTSNPGNGSSSSPATGSSATDSNAANQSRANGAKSGRPSSANTDALDRPDATADPSVSASCPAKKRTKSTTHTISPDAAGPLLAPALTVESAKGKVG